MFRKYCRGQLLSTYMYLISKYWLQMHKEDMYIKLNLGFSSFVFTRNKLNNESDRQFPHQDVDHC